VVGDVGVHHDLPTGLQSALQTTGCSRIFALSVRVASHDHWQANHHREKDMQDARATFTACPMSMQSHHPQVIHKLVQGVGKSTSTNPDLIALFQTPRDSHPSLSALLHLVVKSRSSGLVAQILFRTHRLILAQRRHLASVKCRVYCHRYMVLRNERGRRWG